MAVEGGGVEVGGEEVEVGYVRSYLAGLGFVVVALFAGKLAAGASWLRMLRIFGRRNVNSRGRRRCLSFGHHNV